MQKYRISDILYVMNTLAIQVQDKGVITIPKQLRDIWNLSKGDFLNITFGKDREAVVEPLEVVDKSILLASQKALQELRNGKTAGPFKNMDDFEKSLGIKK